LIREFGAIRRQHRHPNSLAAGAAGVYYHRAMHLNADLRRQYEGRPLSRRDLHPNPIEQFGRWFDDASSHQVIDPNAMVLATADAMGRPSARYVLLKHFDDEGFVFFTDTLSVKGMNLNENPRAALVFYWAQCSRQIRIEGKVVPVDEDLARSYFDSRPRGSRLAALISHQSRVVKSRRLLEQRLAEADAKYAGQTIPMPPSWGGYRIQPHKIEFWQGRENRLHDRFVYRLRGEDDWIIERLYP
jgi:pyridoxamine 5'-phosphate oxidase